MTRLRPGLHVTRRDDQYLQIGLDPPWRVVAPDHPAVRRLLDDLAADRPPAPETPEAHRVLQALSSAGMVLEGAPPDPDGAVAVVGSGPMVAEASRVLRAAGCAVTHGADDRAEVVLLLAEGELARADVDALMRSGRAHLVVAGSAYGVTIGPLVEPGSTACLRCVDAHRGEHDPRRAVVLEQLGGRPGGIDDPALRILAAAWAARDVLTYLAGGRPAAWSATVTIGPALEPVRAAWARHPHCGCSWDQGLVG